MIDEAIESGAADGARAVGQIVIGPHQRELHPLVVRRPEISFVEEAFEEGAGIVQPAEQILVSDINLAFAG